MQTNALVVISAHLLQPGDRPFGFEEPGGECLAGSDGISIGNGYEIKSKTVEERKDERIGNVLL